MSKAVKKTIVKETMDFGTKDSHPVVSLIDSNEAPEIKSVGLFRLPETNTYVSFTMITKGREVVSIEVEQPNLRAVAEESAKISFVSTFMDNE